MSVLHLILNVTEFVVDKQEIVEIDCSAHADAEIFAVKEIPSRRMTNTFPVCLSLQH